MDPETGALLDLSTLADVPVHAILELVRDDERHHNEIFPSSSQGLMEQSRLAIPSFVMRPFFVIRRHYRDQSPDPQTIGAITFRRIASPDPRFTKKPFIVVQWISSQRMTMGHKNPIVEGIYKTEDPTKIAVTILEMLEEVFFLNTPVW